MTQCKSLQDERDAEQLDDDLQVWFVKLGPLYTTYRFVLGIVKSHYTDHPPKNKKSSEDSMECQPRVLRPLLKRLVMGSDERRYPRRI